MMYHIGCGVIRWQISDFLSDGNDCFFFIEFTCKKTLEKVDLENVGQGY